MHELYKHNINILTLHQLLFARVSGVRPYIAGMHTCLQAYNISQQTMYFNKKAKHTKCATKAEIESEQYVRMPIYIQDCMHAFMQTHRHTKAYIYIYIYIYIACRSACETQMCNIMYVRATCCSAYLRSYTWPTSHHDAARYFCWLPVHGS
jgi:hypothetical protein